MYVCGMTSLHKVHLILNPSLMVTMIEEKTNIIISHNNKSKLRQQITTNMTIQKLDTFRFSYQIKTP